MTVIIPCIQIDLDDANEAPHHLGNGLGTVHILRRPMDKKEFIKAYKQEYRTILAVLQKVGVDYINSDHIKGNPLEHLEYVLKSVRESCEKSICKVCNKRREEEKKDQKKKMKIVK